MNFLGKSSFWIKTLLAAGTALAIALALQTIVNYRYVSDSLIDQEARRVAQDTVRSVERAAGASRPQDAAAFKTLLDDLRAERSDRVAVFALRRGGTVVAASGEPTATPVADTGPQAPPPDRDVALPREQRGGRDVLIAMLPCRCGLPNQTQTQTQTPPPTPAQTPGPQGRPQTGGRYLMEVGLYRDSLGAPFARLRRDAIVSASAALTLLFSLAFIAIRFGPYVRDKQLEVQMELARQVQRDLSPAPGTRPVGLDVAAECIPASRVGGDFYDVVSLPRDRYAFVVGDVSGHGVSAAMLTGLIYGAMSSPSWGVLDDEPDRAASLNHLLLTKSSAERFASLFWCSYEPASGRLRYLNAGHLPSLWVHRGPSGAITIDRLAVGGPVLGLLANAEFPMASIQAAAGDLVVLFSDGIVEATNELDEYFGEDQLIGLVQERHDLPAQAICDAVLAAVRTFAGKRPIQDDQTLLVVRLPAPGLGTSPRGQA